MEPNTEVNHEITVGIETVQALSASTSSLESITANTGRSEEFTVACKTVSAIVTDFAFDIETVSTIEEISFEKEKISEICHDGCLVKTEAVEEGPFRKTYDNAISCNNKEMVS